MTLNSAAAAEALRALLAGLSGVSGAQIGVPESIGGRLYGYVTAGSQSVQRISLGRAKGRVQREARFLLTLAYRLDGNEAAAENALMAAVDQLLMEVAIGTQLTNAGQIVAVDSGLADTPDYVARSAKEFREYPVLVTVQQFVEMPAD